MGKSQLDKPTVGMLIYRPFDRSTHISAAGVADRSFHTVLRRAEQQLVVGWACPDPLGLGRSGLQLTTQDGPIH